MSTSVDNLQSSRKTKQPRPYTGGVGVRTLLRKTKNKTYSAIRGRSRPPQLSLDQSPVGLPVQRSKSNVSGVSHVYAEAPRVNSWDEVTTQPDAGFASRRLDYHDHSAAAKDEGMETIVRTLERVLRQALISCGMFIAGTMFPQFSPMASHLMELSFVAWATCLLIVILGWIQGNKRQNDTYTMHNNRHTPYSRVDIESQSLEQSLIPGTTATPAQTPASHEIFRFDQEEHDLQAERRQISELECLYIMSENERIIPNGLETKIENELLSGTMLLMFRTSEVDNPTSTPDDPFATYFRGKQRRFEFQWQFTLKKIPKGEFFLGAELEEPVRLGMIQRALANTALKFVKKMNQGFSYHISDTDDSPSFLSFPIGTSMDRFCETPPGEIPPSLGQEIKEDESKMKLRKKGAKIDWKLDRTYTMGLWSAYLDWIDWQLMNFPGIRPFSVTSLAGFQPIKLTLYSTSDESGDKDSKRNILFGIEVSNSTKSVLGKEAKVWMESNRTTPAKLSEEEDTDHFFPIDLEAPDDVLIDDCEEDEVSEIDDAENLDTQGYLLSGSPIALFSGEEKRFISSGGGYAVLQSSPTSSIVLEKFHHKKERSNPSVFIRSGDIVRIKLVDEASKSVRYLTIHRGWWLKWTSARPKRHGMFYIRTNEAIGSLVVLNGQFSLVSRKWRHYTVGVCVESSMKYGGNLLGIYKTPHIQDDEEVAEEEEEEEEEADDKDEPEGTSSDRIKPLLLRAEPHALDGYTIPSPTRALKPPRDGQQTFESTNEDIDAGGTFNLAQKKYEIDVPIWLEVMDRARRTKQLVYAVRINEYPSRGTDDVDDDGPCRVYLKLRSGRELEPVLRLGLSGLSEADQPTFDLDSVEKQDSDADSFTSSSDESDSEEEDNDDHIIIAGPNHGGNILDDEYSSECEDENVRSTKNRGPTDSVTMKRNASLGDVREASTEDMLHITDFLETPATGPANKKKGRIIGRVAKTVTASTVVTGKTVIKTLGKGTVKSTVSAGRAVTMPMSSVVYNKRPKRHEPRGRGIGRRKRSHKSQMKSLGKTLKTIQGQGHLKGHATAGSLLFPDQSCRLVSSILSQISSISSNPLLVNETISTLTSASSAHDLAFLRGCSAELGVRPLLSVDPKSDTDCVVARCLYDGRWVEELCIFYTDARHLAFYSPLSKKPSLVVTLDEIEAVRILDDNETFPLPTYFSAAIETTLKCHYITFLTSTHREDLIAKLNGILTDENQSNTGLDQNGKGSEFEAYKMPLEAALTTTGMPTKWENVKTGKKSKQKKQRKVLNSRIMPFDLDPILSSSGDSQEEICHFVEGLLERALSFSPDDALDMNDTRFVDFLNETSRLRSLPLEELDLTSKQAFCIFVNLYHTLLQHSLLIAVDGLPSKRSVTAFKRCSCYEIGDDVFSLSELECMVIRGKLGRPVHARSPFVEPPKKSRSYLMYALASSDYRVNFILNNGDISYPNKVPIYNPRLLDDQMDAASFTFLSAQVKIDAKKRSVFLPNVCNVYRSDFANDALVCLQNCLRFLEEHDQLFVASLLENGVVSIKFLKPSEMFHASLSEMSALL